MIDEAKVERAAIKAMASFAQLVQRTDAKERDALVTGYRAVCNSFRAKLADAIRHGGAEYILVNYETEEPHEGRAGGVAQNSMVEVTRQLRRTSDPAEQARLIEIARRVNNLFLALLEHAIEHGGAERIMQIYGETPMENC